MSPYGIIWFVQHNLWWVYTSLQREVMCMNFSFSDMIVFEGVHRCFVDVYRQKKEVTRHRLTA